IALAPACRDTPKPEGKPAPVGLPPAAAGAAPRAEVPPAPSPHGGDLPPNHPPIDPRQPMPEPKNVDPTQVLEGTIDVAPAFKDQVKAGDVIFLAAKRVDASGQITRMPITVDRLEVGTLPMKFRLTGANVMTQGAEFTGDIALIARVDRDRD